MSQKLFFEDYTFDLDTCRLIKAGTCVPLEPQVGLVLKILLRNAGTYVTRQTLLEHVWNNKAVCSAVVDNRIRAVRLALGDDGKTQRLIKTYPNKGYMFIGTLTQCDTIEIQTPALSASGLVNPKPSMMAVFGAFVAMVALIGVFVLSRTEVQPTAPMVSSVQAGLADNSIAVLPFGGASEGTLERYHALGLENVVVGNLTSAPALKVISPLSSFRFGPDAQASDVSKALGARFVVSGELRSLDNTAQLVLRVTDTRSNTLVYADSHDLGAGSSSPTSDSFDTVHHASLRILNQIGASPDPSSGKLLPQDAFEAFGFAQHILRSARDARLLSAIDALAGVIATEPDFIPAYRDIVISYHLAAEYAGLNVTEASRHIDTYAQRASARFGVNADILVIRALQARYRADLMKSLEYLDAATDLDAENADAALLRAEVLELLGDASRADRAYGVALSFDPISPVILSKVARSKFGLGLHEQAFATAKKNLTWNPDDIDAQIDLAVFYRETGAYDMAYAMLNKALVAHPRNARGQFELLLTLTYLGRADVAHQFDLNQELKVLAYTFEGKEDQARLAQTRDPLGVFTGYMEYTFGNSKPLYRFLSSTGRYESFRDRATAVSSLYIFDAIFYAHASLGISDEDARQILENVRGYYKDRPPETLKSLEEFLALAGLHALEGDAGSVNLVLDAATKKGFYFSGALARGPVFAKVRSDPAFQERVGAMQKQSRTFAATFLP